MSPHTSVLPSRLSPPCLYQQSLLIPVSYTLLNSIKVSCSSSVLAFEAISSAFNNTLNFQFHPSFCGLISILVSSAETFIAPSLHIINNLGNISHLCLPQGTHSSYAVPITCPTLTVEILHHFQQLPIHSTPYILNTLRTPFLLTLICFFRVHVCVYNMLYTHN